MNRKALPPHIEKLCHDWHNGEASEIWKFGTFQDFDPAGVIREIEISKENLGEKEKERNLSELIKLKRYVMNLTQRELARLEETNGR